jgi:hypothetical protein
MNSSKRSLGALGAAVVLLLAGVAVAQDQEQRFVAVGGKALGFGITPDLRTIPEWKGDQIFSGERVVNPMNERRVKLVKPGAGAGDGDFEDPLLRNTAPAGAMPGPTITWLGMVVSGSAPPDTTADVGPNHVVELVNNTRIQVWNKAGGSLFGPVSIRTLFTGLPAADPCRAGGDDGDPIVLYDPLADRWLISQFEVSAFPNRQCIAISQTGDPAGGYYAYSFIAPPSQGVNKFQDYPHYGVWPDAYHMTTNQFNQALTAFVGAGIFAYERSKMIAGDPTAGQVYVDTCPTSTGCDIGGTLPTDLDGYVAPPAGLPQIVMEWRADEFGDPQDAIRSYRFVPNFANPAASTFTVQADIALAAFDARQPTGRADVEQLGGDGLDAIPDRLMFRLAYRNLNGTNSWVGSFTVNVSGVNPTSAATYQTGIRWFELHSTGTAQPTVFDQGTHNLAPNNGASGLNNWMGSIAQDSAGNLGLGFSQSGTGQRANIVIAGRDQATPAGTLNAGEALFFAATGSQTGTSNRWGDYSAMSVDPVDDCAFWYAQEYYDTTGAFLWRTRIGRFIFPNCTAAPRGDINVTVTDCQTAAPVSGAMVTMAGGFQRTTNASGVAGFTAAPGSYAIAATAPGYSTGNTNGTVINGQTTAAATCIQPTAILSAGTTSLNAEACGPVNNAIDPGEVVTVSFCVRNTGPAATTSLVGTLQASGGVISPSGPQNYGVVAAGGGVACRPFSFTASGALSCGANITASLQLQDGATDFGTPTYTLPTGVTTVVTALSENFDGVTAPALPAGWTTTASGVQSPWVTSTTSSDSAPNNAFSPDPSNIGINELVTPSIPITGASQLTFRNNYDLEANFDGGVLEISIAGGAFTDIITAGGSFVAGGYNGTISTSFGSPIAGRQAWTNTSSGYINSVVNLPAAANGQNIQLRWRCGTDNSVADVGWRVDGILISRSNTTCSTNCGGPSDLIFRDVFGN